MNTCNKCKHFKPNDLMENKFGECALMGDSNEGTKDTSKAYGWDYESYFAGVYVGENFGCIHWVKATPTPSTPE